MDNGNVRKIETFSLKRDFDFMVALLQHLDRNPDNRIVPIYDWGTLDLGPKQYSLYIDMMRCGLLEDDEKEFIDQCGEAWDKYGSEVFKELAAGTCEVHAKALRSWQKKLPELSVFLEDIVSEGRYYDLHSGNVMRHEDAQYVMIDLEGYLHSPLELEENSWITR